MVSKGKIEKQWMGAAHESGMEILNMLMRAAHVSV